MANRRSHAPTFSRRSESKVRSLRSVPILIEAIFLEPANLFKVGSLKRWKMAELGRMTAVLGHSAGAGLGRGKSGSAALGRCVVCQRCFIALQSQAADVQCQYSQWSVSSVRKRENDNRISTKSWAAHDNPISTGKVMGAATSQRVGPGPSMFPRLSKQ